ncbi:MAG: hypothetical protein AAGJ54_07460 [Planctomycetota bacterium]
MRFISPLLFFTFCATRWKLAQQNVFLKDQADILRARLPEHLRTTPQERARLLRSGKPVSDAMEGLMVMVHPSTFMRWVREEGKQADSGKPKRKR